MFEERFIQLVEENGGFEFYQAYRGDVDLILGGKGNTFWYVVMKKGKVTESYIGKNSGGAWEDVCVKGSGFGSDDIVINDTPATDNNGDDGEGSILDKLPKSDCPICHFCPQPLGLCIFIWLIIIVAVIAVVVVVVVLVKKKKNKADKENK